MSIKLYLLALADVSKRTRFSKGSGVDPDTDTITPFGKAFYKREASYFVIPYVLLVLINLIVSAGSAAFWSIPAAAAAQVLRQFYIHLSYLHLFDPTWYRLPTLYGLIASAFVLLLLLQSLAAMAWVIATKWIVIGRRKEGSCAWDTHSYCMFYLMVPPLRVAYVCRTIGQRWQLHLTLSRLLYRGHGNGGVLAPLTGSAYIVW